MDNTVTLEYPITVNCASISRISLRRPKVSDELAAKKAGDSEMQEITLIANLAELAPSDILQLDSADFRKLTGVLLSFFA